MPRPIIGTSSAAQQGTSAGVNHGLRGNRTRTTRQRKSDLKLNLRQRSRRYLDVVAGFDVGHGHADVDVAETHRSIEEEFRPEFDLVPEGVVAKCYLGGNYEVHTLDPIGGIVEHYERGQPLPAVLERARRLANHSSYVCIEVYSGHLLCVRADGSTSEVR